ncbi:aquaporin SIP1-2-like [Senna tora]|uniref:Aquaporin SIP1-2-like n=1 Tax=Senna tora TaxID=362788 RepID=A0A834XBD9_9FABA|nr:aquaporin SIP1-2-like [Senna tora]
MASVGPRRRRLHSRCQTSNLHLQSSIGGDSTHGGCERRRGDHLPLFRTLFQQRQGLLLLIFVYYGLDSVNFVSSKIGSVLGAAGGALAIMEVMPSKYKHMLGGPSLKVDLHTGTIAEGVLTFLISFANY